MMLLTVLVISVVSAQAYFPYQLSYNWDQFKLDHGKFYEEEEEALRLLIFAVNMERISEHNRKYDRGESTYWQRANQFTDMTESEIKEMLNGQLNGPFKHRCTPYVSKLEAPPPSVDWRESNIVTNVKNQSRCGSCWAFSTLGSLESMTAIRTGKLESLSVQNLLDCNVENHGCSGGFPNLAFKYIIINGGINTEASYPYEGKEGTCRFNRSDTAVTMRSYVDIPKGDENALKNAVAFIGPVSVAIDADWNFMNYGGGVFDDHTCSSHFLNHAVLNVGYDTINGTDYWIIKNSWGTTWGEDGYVKMSRNKNNQCGIASVASYPVVG